MKADRNDNNPTTTKPDLTKRKQQLTRQKENVNSL